MLKFNSMALYIAITFTFSMLFMSCEPQPVIRDIPPHSMPSEIKLDETAEVVNESKQSEVLKEVKDSELPKDLEILDNSKEPKCKVYSKHEFEDEFTCLFFEDSVFSYDDYSKQVITVEDCDVFYSDLKIKNDAICEKYKCSDKELKEYCDEEFEYEDDTIAKRDACAEKKCPDYKFTDGCDNFESLCAEAIVLDCLNKSKLPRVDMYIAQCVDSNKFIISNRCKKHVCVNLGVQECIEKKCKQKPTKEYYNKCKEESKSKCSTQDRLHVSID